MQAHPGYVQKHCFLDTEVYICRETKVCCLCKVPIFTLQPRQITTCLFSTLSVPCLDRSYWDSVSHFHDHFHDTHLQSTFSAVFLFTIEYILGPTHAQPLILRTNLLYFIVVSVISFADPQANISFLSGLNISVANWPINTGDLLERIIVGGHCFHVKP